MALGVAALAVEEPGLGAMQPHHQLARPNVAIDNYFVPTPCGRCIVTQLQPLDASPMSAPQIGQRSALPVAAEVNATEV